MSERFIHLIAHYFRSNYDFFYAANVVIKDGRMETVRLSFIVPNLRGVIIETGSAGIGCEV